MRNIRLVKFCV